MTKPFYDVVLDLLKTRDGMATEITLEGGRTTLSYNIAWGFDLGNPVAYITTNISPPSPEGEHRSESFFADEVVRVVDPEYGVVWFERAD